MTTANSSTIFDTNTDSCLNAREALARILDDQKVSRDQLAKELGVHVDVLGTILDDTGPDNVGPWLAVHDRLVDVLSQHGQLTQGAASDDTNPHDARAEVGADPFAGAGEEVFSEDTRRRVELLAWADS